MVATVLGLCALCAVQASSVLLGENTTEGLPGEGWVEHRTLLKVNHKKTYIFQRNILYSQLLKTMLKSM